CAPANSVLFHYSTSGTRDGSQEVIFSARGLTELRLQNVGGSSSSGAIGIESLFTANIKGKPDIQHVTNFEQESSGVKSASYTPDPGRYYSTGSIGSTSPPGMVTSQTLNASFAGDSLYAPSSASFLYNILQVPLNAADDA